MLSKGRPFGRNRRINPLPFSLEPRSPEQYGWDILVRFDSLRTDLSIWDVKANSVPLSEVIDLKISGNRSPYSCSSPSMAVTTAEAVLSGSFRIISCLVIRSTSVSSTAPFVFLPMIVSISQWPNSLRSFISAGYTILPSILPNYWRLVGAFAPDF